MVRAVVELLSRIGKYESAAAKPAASANLSYDGTVLWFLYRAVSTPDSMIDRVCSLFFAFRLHRYQKDRFMPDVRSPHLFLRRLLPLMLLVAVCVSLLGSAVLRAAVPALSITVTDSRATASPGESLTYTLRARNSGATPLASVRIRVQLPSSVTFEDASDSPTDLGGGLYEWTIASLDANRTVSRFVVAQVNAPLADETILTTSAAVDQVGDPTPNMATDATTIAAPVVKIEPASLIFAEQLRGSTSAPQTVTITNDGSADLTISAVNITGDWAETNTCSAPLVPQASCTIDVTFTPTASGTRSGTLTITSDAAGSPNTIDLSGTGVAPRGAASPATLPFGNQRVGVASAPQTVTFTNVGDAPLTLDDLTIDGDYAIDSITCSTQTPLAPDANCTIDIVFTPTAGGTRSGTLTITSDADNSPQTVSLTGAGVAPGVSVDPVGLDFGDQRVGATSTARSVALTNSGTGTLAISGITITSGGEWAQTSDCSATLAPGASCTINVTFTPSATGTRSGTLTIAHDAANSPTTIDLAGTGIAPGVDLNKTSLDFGGQRVGTTSGSQTVTLTNNGSAALAIGTIAVDGAWAQTNDCASSLPVDASCTITVTFAPTTTGAQTGALTIGSDAAGSPHTVSLTGTGIAPAVSLDPATLDFGNQPVGITSAARTLTITNSGSDALEIDDRSIAPTGDFEISNSTCPTSPASLPAMASCTVSITFTPSTTGNRSATLTIGSDAAGSPHTVALTGIGTQPDASLSPTTLDFASQIVGTTSSAKSVTLTNTGTDTLTLGAITIDGEWAQTNTCSATLAPGASCSFSVTFTPGAAGDRSGALTVNSNAPGGPHTVALTGVGNRAPVAADDPDYTVNENSTLTVSAPGVLDNDSDPDSDGLTAVLETGPTNGALSLNANGSFTYTPNTDYNGPESFTYRASDGRGGLSALATVNIAVVGINDPPSLTAGKDVRVLEDGGAYSQLWATDISAGENGQTLTITTDATNLALFSTPPALADDGTLTFTPAADAFGQSTVTITMQDNGGRTNNGWDTATYTFKITIDAVNDPPSYTKGGDITVAEDSGPNTATSWASNFSVGPANESSQTLVFGTLTTNDALFAVKPVLNGSGTLTFTPAPNANGTAQVTLRIRDSGGTANGGQDVYGATMTITVTPSNDEPTATDDDVTAIKNRAQTIAAATLLRNDTDIDGDTLTVSGVSATTTAGGAVTLTGDTLLYTPSTDFVGADSFTYTVRDGSGATDIATVNIDVRNLFTAYLPLIASSTSAPLSQPDLVGSFTLTPNKTSFSTGEAVQITATVKNDGTAPASAFWVDLYINPSSAPTTTNQAWNTLCGLNPCYGIAWYVPNGLAPGQSITLTSTAGSYAVGSTRWNGSFASGTSDIYLYVDSWNPDVAFGAVAEASETNNRAELHGLVVSGANVAPLGEVDAVDLPPRPRRLDDE